MNEQARRVDDVRDALRHLEERLDGRFQAMDQKLDAHFVAIDAKISRLTTLQVGTLLAVVAALAGMLSDFTR